MATALRYTAAAIAGVACAALIMLGVESIGHAIYPVPPGFNADDPAQVRAYVQSLPSVALLFPLLGWLVATLFGGWLAAVIARRHQRLFAGIVGVVALLGAAANFAMIPHPAWVMVAAAIGIPTAAWLAGRLAARVAGRSPPR